MVHSGCLLLHAMSDCLRHFHTNTHTCKVFIWPELHDDEIMTGRLHFLGAGHKSKDERMLQSDSVHSLVKWDRTVEWFSMHWTLFVQATHSRLCGDKLAWIRTIERSSAGYHSPRSSLRMHGSICAWDPPPLLSASPSTLSHCRCHARRIRKNSPGT